MNQPTPTTITHNGNTYRLISNSPVNDFFTRLYNLITALLFSRKTWQSAAGLVIIYLAENAGYSDQMLLAIGGLFAVLITNTAWEDVSKRTGGNVTNVQAETVANVGTTNAAAPLVESPNLDNLSTSSPTTR